MPIPLMRHFKKILAEAPGGEGCAVSPGSASDGLRETLRHSQEMGQSAISIMLKADIEAIEPCLKDSRRLDALLELDIDVKPAEGGGWLLVDWRANPPRTTEHKTGREAIDAALSPNIKVRDARAESGASPSVEASPE